MPGVKAPAAEVSGDNVLSGAVHTDLLGLFVGEGFVGAGNCHKSSC